MCLSLLRAQETAHLSDAHAAACDSPAELAGSVLECVGVALPDTYEVHAVVVVSGAGAGAGAAADVAAGAAERVADAVAAVERVAGAAAAAVACDGNGSHERAAQSVAAAAAVAEHSARGTPWAFCHASCPGRARVYGHIGIWCAVQAEAT